MMSLIKAPLWLAVATGLMFFLFGTLYEAVATLSNAPDFFKPWLEMPTGLFQWLRVGLSWGAIAFVCFATLVLVWKVFKRVTDWAYGEVRAEVGEQS